MNSGLYGLFCALSAAILFVHDQLDNIAFRSTCLPLQHVVQFHCHIVKGPEHTIKSANSGASDPAEVPALMGYPVMEAFYTLQGEGAFTGQAAYFIRLGGCDVGCTWCDVKESWDAAAHPMRSVNELVADASVHPCRLMVITGGEPLMHDLAPLTEAFREAGFRTHIETSGSSPLSGSFDWICLSPKKFKVALPESFEAAHELKVIVFNSHDLKWAQEQAALVNAECALFLQPEWSKRETMMPLITEFIMQHPKWRVSLQTHKILGIP